MKKKSTDSIMGAKVEKGHHNWVYIYCFALEKWEIMDLVKGLKRKARARELSW